MAVIVANCPRCKSNNMTFDVMSQVETGIAYGWQTHFEVPCLCRNCCRTTVFAISQKEYSDEKFLAQNPPVKIQGSLNNYFSVEGFICLKDMGAMDAPEHVPEPIANAFREGAMFGGDQLPQRRRRDVSPGDRPDDPPAASARRNARDQAKDLSGPRAAIALAI